ncbi:MAG: hypothetical protein QFB87_04465 [Patescibacteria group bacterium]|nr:hypothetical protein [Patescibacteria group bacterium]
MTKSINPEIAVLQDQMNNVKDTLNEVRGDVKAIKDALDERFVRKEEFKTFRIVTLTTSVFITAIVTALVYFFISTISKSSVSPEPSVTKEATSTTTASPSAPTAGNTAPAAQPTTATQTPSPMSNSTGGVLVTVPKVP